MSFSTDMDKALNGMDTDQKAAVKTAFTDFQTAIQTEFTAYGTKAMESAVFKDELIDLAHRLMSRMKPKA